MRFGLASLAVDRDQEVIKSLPPFSALVLNTRTQTRLSCTEDVPYSISLLLGCNGTGTCIWNNSLRQ